MLYTKNKKEGNKRDYSYLHTAASFNKKVKKAKKGRVTLSGKPK